MATLRNEKQILDKGYEAVRQMAREMIENGADVSDILFHANQLWHEFKVSALCVPGVGATGMYTADYDHEQTERIILSSRKYVSAAEGLGKALMARQGHGIRQVDVAVRDRGGWRGTCLAGAAYILLPDEESPLAIETGGRPSDPPVTLTPGEPIPSARPSTVRKIFIGKDGLRAGWSLLIFVAFMAALIYCINIGGRKLFPSDPKTGKIDPAVASTPGFLFFGESLAFIVTVLVTWIMSKIERRPSSVYGLGDSRKVAHFLAGLAWGVICLSVLILTLLKLGLLVIDRRLLFGGDIVRYGAMWLAGFLLVGLLEEYLTRGYVQYTLTRGLAGLYQWAFKTRHSAAWGFWTSAIIFSFLFGFGHGKNPGESPIGMLSAGLAGMVFCLSLWRTGSLWWAIGLHTSWDWGQSFLFGVADSGLMVPHRLLATHPAGRPILSGGTTGPEGSIFILAVLALIVLIVFFTLPRGHYGNASKAFE